MNAPRRLRHRLAIEAPQETPDGAGGVVRGFVEIARVWADVRAVAVEGASAADRTLGAITHRVTLRAGACISTAHRLRLGARVLTIAAVRESDIAGRFHECLCTEERP